MKGQAFHGAKLSNYAYILQPNRKHYAIKSLSLYSEKDSQMNRLIFKIIAVIGLLYAQVGCAQTAPRPDFDLENDLLLAHFDCKTDVDDVHSVAATATLLRHPDFREVRYHAVAGAYGVQEGLYVPAEELFEAAFGTHWSDAHADFGKALLEVYAVVSGTLSRGGDIWIPEAGQSDFSAALVRQVRQRNPQIDTRSRIHIVQHSDWNERVTSPESLAYVREHTDYRKIPDGNAEGNGTPGFRKDQAIAWREQLSDPELVALWESAQAIANRYNGASGRYLNKSIAAGGLDFSDVSETCWIFGLEGLEDAKAFFARLAQ